MHLSTPVTFPALEAGGIEPKPLRKRKATSHQGDLRETGEPAAFVSQLRAQLVKALLSTHSTQVKPQHRLQKTHFFIAL